MKRIIFSIITLCMFTIMACAQSEVSMDKKEVKAIEQVIQDFTKAGDQQNAEKAANFLHDSYRVTFNRAFGSEDLMVIDRKAYLDMLTAKKIGGDKRVVDIEQVNISDHIASVRVVLTGEKAVFTSYFNLAKVPDGSWKLISDMPLMEEK